MPSYLGLTLHLREHPPVHLTSMTAIDDTPVTGSMVGTSLLIPRLGVDPTVDHIVISPATVRELDGLYADVNRALGTRLDTLTPTTQLTITEFLNDVGAIARAAGP